MRALFDMIDKAAAHDVPVLLRGENGTGKSVLARRLHHMSERRERPFVVVNCPTLSEELLASELFGHAKGAFTGAVRDQAGRVEAAEGGTLFLDEIAELPPALQAKLLRFVQDHEFERSARTRRARADVRIVAATNRDLDAEVKAGRFREDLLYRLNTFELMVPPLRERREDIVPLARRFLAFFAQTARRRLAAPAPELTPEAEAALAALRLAGQRARAAQRHRARRHPRRRGAHRAGGAARAHRGREARHAVRRRRLHARGRSSASTSRACSSGPRRSKRARGVLGIDTSTLWRKRKKLDEGVAGAPQRGDGAELAELLVEREVQARAR